MNSSLIFTVILQNDNLRLRIFQNFEILFLCPRTHSSDRFVIQKLTDHCPRKAWTMTSPAQRTISFADIKLPMVGGGEFLASSNVPHFRWRNGSRRKSILYFSTVSPPSPPRFVIAARNAAECQITFARQSRLKSQCLRVRGLSSFLSLPILPSLPFFASSDLRSLPRFLERRWEVKRSGSTTELVSRERRATREGRRGGGGMIL